MTKIVHRNQSHFKKLLKAMSYPGRPVAFSAYENYRGEMLDEIIEIAISLVDGEVRLSISDGDRISFEEISIRTNVKEGSIEKADYIIVAKRDIEKLGEIIRKVKKGSYIKPNDSASLIVEVDSFNEGEKLVLSGPGIDGSLEVRIENTKFWLEERNKAVEKFPMGIDIIFVSKDKNILALPRTSQVKVVGG